MWPFSPKLSQEERDRIARRCGLALLTLENCKKATGGKDGACKNLEIQVIGCHAEVVCPELAKAHVRCFKRVVNSKGKESYAACEKEVEAMRRCLRRHKLYPFSGSGGAGARSGSSSPSKTGLGSSGSSISGQ